MRIVTLLSDFGVRDSYVAQMKGVILGICPDCQLIDITHEVTRHDVLMGAFMLETSVPFFPRDTVHIAVVDPGVGSNRLPLAVACEGPVLVGPDNGVLMRAARRLKMINAYEILREGLKPFPVSATFHGRDIFAVAAAQLAAGKPAESVGRKILKPVELDVSRPTVARGSLNCCVIHVDRFGNVITNAKGDALREIGAKRGHHVHLLCHDQRFQGRIVGFYSEVARGELMVVEGSHGYVEIAAREEDAAMVMGLHPTDVLTIVVSESLVGDG